MAWNWDNIWSDPREGPEAVFRAFRSMGERMGEAGLRSLAAPVDPFNRSPFAPIVAVAGVVGVVMLSGVALAAAVVAAAALTALWFLLSRVFGFEIAIDLPTPPSA